MKMEQIECSETSAYNNQTPGKYPKEYIHDSKHGESLKSRYDVLCGSKLVVGINCTLVQALRLCTGRTVHRRSIGIALLFLDHGTRSGRGVSVTPRSLFTPGKDLVPIVQDAGWAQGRSGQVRKISPPPGFDPRTVQPVASRYSD